MDPHNPWKDAKLCPHPYLSFIFQREEKQLELTLEALISQVADLKNSLVSFIYKLENEYDRLTWPSVLDSFALLSGQLNTLNKVLKHEKTPLLRNQVIIPLVLSPDRDEEIMLLMIFVLQKQIQSLNKMCSNLLEKISKEERESESGGLRQNKQTFNPTDTNALVAAVAFGKGLSNRRPPGSGGSVQSGQPGAGAIIAGASGMQQVPMSSAPAQQQPMLAGVQMAQAGQPGKYVAYLTVTEKQEARKLNADVEILLQSLFKCSQIVVLLFLLRYSFNSRK
ncbi:hypothetical protein CIB84_000116 [Bambusicola thoracicus]|uniref:Mediator of RNA polymerase II transcription subunit 8 n=1 Tax=Bambusicola thoracicus TaxID=9083 RepID=A0A2P4TIF4_BAMTH|nr:hypothetical protein CIB84_000116 [Bambusicola thoracicus]